MAETVVDVMDDQQGRFDYVEGQVWGEGIPNRHTQDISATNT